MGSPSPAVPSAATGERVVINFAAFTLDLRAGRLSRDGTTIPLRPKTWAVLLHLVQRPGTLVSREELLDAVWPDVAVTPDTLTKSIGELRTALGDDAKQARIIETVHRRGFRFLGGPRAATVPAAAAVPLVGRDAELRRLHERLARAERGERQTVFVTGPAGVGKTALIEAFLESPALRAARVGLGASIEQHGLREAYMPLLEALERLARGPAAAAVLEALRGNAPSWLAQIPWLAGHEPGLLQRSLQAARPERMLREGVALLEALAVDATLVVVLEDQHWSDPSTVDLLARLGQRRDPARLMLIATYRPAEVAVHDHPLGLMVRTLRGQRRCAELPLHELSAADVQRYLAARFAGATTPPALAGALRAHTDGNPLFLRAVVDHLVASGWILDTAPGWSFAAVPPDADFGVPGDARDMVALQIDRLAPVDRRLLDAASVVTHACTPALLAAALGRPVEEVAATAEALARGERFLRPLSAAPQHYAFVHELYRRVVYGELAPGRRQRLHRRIAEAIEAAAGGQAAEQAPDLAHHFDRGGNVERALHYLRLAAERADRRSALREGIDYLEHGLQLAGELADADTRRRQELALRVALSRAHYRLFGPASAGARENGERALALCAARDEDPGLRFEILHGLAHAYWMGADPGRFAPTLDALEGVARQLGDLDRQLVVDSLRCRTAAMAGQFAEACLHAAAVRRGHAAGASAPPGTIGADPVVGALAHEALAAWMMGQPSRARAALDDAEHAFAELDASPFTRGTVPTFAALLDVLDRAPADALRSSEAALAVAAEYDLAQFLRLGQVLRGWARVHLGDHAAGLADLEDARVAYQQSGARIFGTYILAFVADAHLRGGGLTAGLAATDEALRVAEATADRSYWPELWRLRGELLLASDAADTMAEGCLRRAVELAQANQARALELRASVSLARLWLARGRGAEARRLLAAALEGVEAVDSIDRREAAALLAAPPRRRR